MALALTNYFKKISAAQIPIAYTWNDADPEAAYIFANRPLHRSISRTSDRGVLALSVAFAECVAWRLSQLSNDHLVLLQKAEAVWAGIIDWRYLNRQQLGPRKDWLGPVRGPLWVASDMLDRVVDLTIRHQFAYPEAVCLSYLALHVLPDPKPFKNWRRFAIERLAKFHPRDLKNALGAPVPRELFDPDMEFKPELLNELLAAFLKRLDSSQNHFIIE